MALLAMLDSAVCARWKSRVIPLRLLLPALAIAAASLGGIRAGAWYVGAQWDKERLQQSRAAVVYMERQHERQASAEAAQRATLTRLQAALQKARHEPIPPVQCPPSGDVLDADLPGLSLRLRIIRDSSTADDSTAGVAGVR